MNKNFPYKENDVVSFPDTESEFVDVGIGAGLKVAESKINTVCRVVKRGLGYQLKMLEPSDYSEIFHRKGHRPISLKEYLNYFGSFKELKKIGTWDKNKKVVYA